MNKKNIKKIVSFSLTLVIFLLLISIFSAPVTASANITESMTKAIKDFNLPSGGADPETKALSIAGLLINAFLSLFGIIFMILIIYGGYKWMLAAGREDEINSAKEIIKAAVIGLIIVMASYAITYFVVSRLQSAVG